MSELSRRDFLKLTGAALAAPFLPKPPQGVPQPPPQPPVELSSGELPKSIERKRLEEAGLADYFEVWQEGEKIQSVLGVSPSVFVEVFETLDAVTSLNVDSNNPKISLLRDGFGKKEREAVDEAKRYTRSIPMSFQDIVAQDPQERAKHESDYRSFLERAAEWYPLHVLALPPQVNVVQSGGGAALDYTNLPSLKEKEWAAVTFLHEATHQFDTGRENGGWIKVKPYLKKENFINYVKTYYKSSYNVLQYFSNLPPDESSRIVFRNDAIEINLNPLVEKVPLLGIFGYDPEKMKDSDFYGGFEYLLQEWQSKIGIEEDIYIPSNDLKDISLGWKTFLSRFLKRWIELSDPQRKVLLEKDHELSEVLKNIAYGYGAQGYGLSFEGILGGISHYLVGPVQSRWGKLPDSWWQPEQNFLILQDIALQQARLSGFSKLDNIYDYSLIRQSFGLPKQLPEGEAEGRALKFIGGECLVGIGVVTLTNLTERLLGIRRLMRQRTENEQLARTKFGEMMSVQIIGEDGNVHDKLPSERIFQFDQISVPDSITMDTFSPRLVVITDIDGRDSVIVLPPINRATKFSSDYSDQKSKEDLYVAVSGPMFGVTDGKLVMAHAPNKNYFHPANSHERISWPWKKTIVVYVGNKRYNITPPWSKIKNDSDSTLNIKSCLIGRIETTRVL